MDGSVSLLDVEIRITEGQRRFGWLGQSSLGVNAVKCNRLPYPTLLRKGTVPPVSEVFEADKLE